MKKAIIIGGTSGIGKALAELLLEQGYAVGISGVERDDLSGLTAQYSKLATVKYIDCSKENCTREIAELAQTIGGLDLLVYSAGIAHMNQDHEFDVQNRANKVNVLGFTEVADWTYRYFQTQGSGHFVGISSIAGLFGFRNAPAYTAAKGYQINYLEALRQRAHRSQLPIYVTDIRPGFVDTEISNDQKRFWMASPEKAAKQIMHAIQRRRKVVYVTNRWRLMAITIQLIPAWLRSRL